LYAESAHNPKRFVSHRLQGARVPPRPHALSSLDALVAQRRATPADDDWRGIVV
jgi:hypothetical protein